MRIVIVNENDEEIGVKEAKDRLPDDIYRSSSLWLTNEEGHVLMAQRSFSKTNSPGLWGPAASGTVEEGETYETNIVKEIEEEIGLSIPLTELIKGPKIRTAEIARVFFNQWYLYTCNKPANLFVLQKEEVEQVAWFTPKELQEALAGNGIPLLPNAPLWLPTLLQAQKGN